MKIITQITFWLTIIGALNWGLVGAFGMNLVTALFGEASLLTHLVYILVGLSALWLVVDSIWNPKSIEHTR